VNRSSSRENSLARRILALAALVSLCSCSPQAPIIHFPAQTSANLPPALTNGPITLAKILQVRDSLTNSQLNVALRQLLGNPMLASESRQEASYIMARLLQTSSNGGDQKESITLFQKAQAMPALHQLASWHISELAATLGQEKLVRTTLREIAEQASSADEKAAAEYALAQSQLRASENNEAASAFSRIRQTYPGTKYAIGSAYYLGEIALSRNEQTNHQGPPPREAIALFNQYLQAAPNGHFASIICSRLQQMCQSHPSSFSDNDRNLYARTAFAQGRWQDALTLWQKGNPQAHQMEVALCLAKMGAIEKAKAALFNAIKHNPSDYRYVMAANDICRRLNSGDALKFWRQIAACKPKKADAVLWNIARRSPPASAIPIYRQLAASYQSSAYAPESCWWVFWDMAMHSSGKASAQIARTADFAAQKYSRAKAAPRFLFWAGKMSERAGDSRQAEVYYRKTVASFPADYYGYRASYRLAALQKVSSAYGFAKHNIASADPTWYWPDPAYVEKETANPSSKPFWELVRLKEYAESLQHLPDQAPEMEAWLYARLSQTYQAIAVASSHLAGPPTPQDLWQYAYPLLYTKEIQNNCKAKKNVDPFLMHALIREESRYNHLAVSSSKAIGLTQVMPGTAYGVAKRLNISIGNPLEFFQPALNIQLGTDYFSLCLSRFHDNPVLAVASYNGGAGAVKSWISRQNSSDVDVFVENIPYKETREYVRKVFQSYWTYCAVYRKVR
jgi:soluble lytic murein transglycosylase